MKCIKCLSKNIYKANYCRNCGYQFSSKEQKIAKRKTIIGKIEYLEELYDNFRFKFITDHIVFKILSILIVLGIGIVFIVKYDNNLKLVNSDNYKIQYNKRDNEYYIITNNYEVPLEIYVPESCESLSVTMNDNDNQFITKKNYLLDDDIILETKLDKSYYIIEGKNKNGDVDKLKVYIFLEKA